jgi:hypothetical protein
VCGGYPWRDMQTQGKHAIDFLHRMTMRRAWWDACILNLSFLIISIPTRVKFSHRDLHIT